MGEVATAVLSDSVMGQRVTLGTWLCRGRAGRRLARMVSWLRAQKTHLASVTNTWMSQPQPVKNRVSRAAGAAQAAALETAPQGS